MRVRGHSSVAEREDEIASSSLGRETLFRLALEAAELEDRGKEVFDGIREGGSAAALAPPGHAIAARYIQMRYELPNVEEPRLHRCAEVLDVVFDHHAELIYLSLVFLVAGQISGQPEIYRLDRLYGFGATSDWLSAIVAALRDDQLERLDSLPPTGRRSPLPF
jgi:hypothetical protein